MTNDMMLPSDPRPSPPDGLDISHRAAWTLGYMDGVRAVDPRSSPGTREMELLARLAELLREPCAPVDRANARGALGELARLTTNAFTRSAVDFGGEPLSAEAQNANDGASSDASRAPRIIGEVAGVASSQPGGVGGEP